MKKYISPLMIVVLAAVLGFSGIAGQQHSQTEKKQSDTVPVRNDIRSRDLDKALEELDKAKLQLQEELSKQDWSAMEKQFREAMKEVDMAKIQADMQKALAEVDMEKIKAEVAASLSAIDKEKIRADVEASLSKVDMEKIKKELEKVKEVDLKKVQEELEKIKPEIEKSLQDAKVQIEKAKAEIREYKNFINDLDAEGYLNKKEPYTIVHKNNQLIVNGKPVPEAFYNKHKDFLEKHKEFTLKSDEDNININHN